MKFRNARVVTALAAFGLFVALAGLIAPSALGATKYELRFVTQPQDSQLNATIRASDLNQDAAFVQVKLVDAVSGVTITNTNASVTFTLKSGAGFASGSLSVTPQRLVNGVATFGTGTLSIGTLNEPQFTSYALVPRTAKNPLITGPASAGFDIWESGESCTGGLDTCEASLRGGNDTYTLDANGTLGASRLTGADVLPGLVCPKQKAVFSNTVFSYATTETDGIPNVPVSLTSIITQDEWRASASNGQAHADWCIGLVDPGPWNTNGANYKRLDTDGVGGPDLYVALAPNCPVANPSAFAPCIVSQNPDGNGGNITIGWLTGGDPPRRT